MCVNCVNDGVYVTNVIYVFNVFGSARLRYDGIFIYK